MRRHCLELNALSGLEAGDGEARWAIPKAKRGPKHTFCQRIWLIWYLNIWAFWRKTRLHPGFFFLSRPLPWLLIVWSVDYRCGDGRFWVFASCVTISNTTIRFPSVKRGLILEEEAEKEHFSQWAWCLRPIGGIYFTKKCRDVTVQDGLEFGSFKPLLKEALSQRR